MNWALEHRLDGTIGRIVETTPDGPAIVIEVGQTWQVAGETLYVTGILEGSEGPFVTFGIERDDDTVITGTAELVARAGRLLDQQG